MLLLLLLPPNYCSMSVVDIGVRALTLTVWVLTVPWLCALQLQRRATGSRQQHQGGRLLGGNAGDTRLASPHHTVTAQGPRSPGEDYLLEAVGHPTPSQPAHLPKLLAYSTSLPDGIVYER